MERQASAKRNASREKNSSTISFRASKPSSMCVASPQTVAMALFLTYPFLTNARKRIADQHIYDPAATITRCHENRAGRLFPHLPDHLRILASRREAQGV